MNRKRKKGRKEKKGKGRKKKINAIVGVFPPLPSPPPLLPLDVRNPCPRSERVQVVGKHGAFRSKIDFPLEGLSSARYCALKSLSPPLALLSRLLEVGAKADLPLPGREGEGGPPARNTKTVHLPSDNNWKSYRRDEVLHYSD